MGGRVSRGVRREKGVMAKPRNRRFWSLFRLAGVGAALVLVVTATATSAAPAISGGGTSSATVTLSSSVPGIGLVTGEAVSFTATITTSGAPATGDVVFSVVGADGTVVTCDGGDTQPISTSGGVTTATCSFADGLLRSPLFYTISADLVDPNHTAPTATLIQQIRKSLTDTTISGLPRSVIAGEGFTFTATVQDTSPGTGSPTGSMQFAICPLKKSPPCAGSPSGASVMPAPTMAEQALNENMITFSLPSGVLKPGLYDVSAIYVGDPNYRSSPSRFRLLAVTRVPTTLSLEPSRNPAFDGGRLVLRAVITADPRATSSLRGPSGTATFTITGASGDTLVCRESGTPVIPVGTNSANHGVARCSVTGEIQTSDSPYTVGLVYSGDSIYTGSSASGSVTVVNKP
jgi:hypothetical protein